MKDDKKVPQLRFPEFTDAWKQRKFGDSFDFLQNNTLSRASLNDTSGCAKNVHYGDILVKFGESISAEKADLPFICEREILKKLSKSILKNGDVVIADTAEDMTTGKSCEIVDVDECMPVLAGLHTIPVRPKQKFGKYYLGYYLNSEAFHSQLIPLIQGIKVYSISKSSIKDTVVMFPDDVQEQEKIGSLFNRIDNTITLQQRKLNSLQKLKKGLLQKMFPKKGENIPEIRFPEFSDAWKQRKFGEFVERKSDSALSSTSIPSVEYENVESETGILKKDIYVKTEFKKGVLFSDKDVLYGKLRPYLHNWLAPSFTGVAVGDWWVLSPKNCSKDFLYRLLQTLTFDEIANQTSGTKMPRADWNLVSSTAFYIPSSIEEQAKIGSLFNRIDSTITLQQRKLESLQKLKKGLLQQMFI